MTTTQEDDMQPTHLIHWLDEDSLILEVHQDNYCRDREQDLPIDSDLNRIVQEQVRDYQTTDNLGRMIERELDNLTTIIPKAPRRENQGGILAAAGPGLIRPPYDALSPDYRNAAAPVAQPRRGAKTRERVDA